MGDLRTRLIRYVNYAEAWSWWPEREEIGATGMMSSLRKGSRKRHLMLILVYSKPAWLLILAILTLLAIVWLFPSRTVLEVNTFQLVVLTAVYSLYTLLLEIASRIAPQPYDKEGTRWIRIGANLLFACAVITVSGGAYSYYWIVFLFPLLQAATYFVETPRKILLVLVLTILFFVLISVASTTSVVDPALLSANGATLAFITGLSYGLYSLSRQTQNVEHFEALLTVQQLPLAFDYNSDFENTLSSVAETLVKPLNAEEATIFLYDKEQRLLYQVASQSETEAAEKAGRHVFALGQGIAGHVARQQKAYLCHDAEIDPYFDHNSHRAHRIRSLLAAPIVADNQVLGVLSVDSPLPHKFNQNDLQLLLAFAAYLGDRLQRSRLLEALRDLGQSYDELHEDVLQSILVQLQEVIPYDSASLFLRHSDQLRVKSHAGYPNPQKVEDLAFSVLDALFQQVEKTQRPVILEDAQESAAFRGHGDASHIHGWLAVPLIIGGEVIGFLSLDSRKKAFFSNSDAELAAIFARHAALAIRRAEYHQKWEEWILENELHSEQVEALNQFSTEVNLDLRLKRVLGSTVQRVGEWFEVSRTAIALIEDGADHAQVIAHWPVSPGPEERTSISLSSAIAQHILRTKEPLSIEDAKNEPLLQEDGIREIILKHDICSMLIVPILINGEVVGTIGLDVLSQQRLFSQSEIEWAKRIALQSGLAINNARQHDQWYRRAQRRADYLEWALKASEKVAALRKGDDALKAIADNLRRLFSYDSVILFPYLAFEEEFEQPVIAGSLRFEDLVRSKVVSKSRVAELIHFPQISHFANDSKNDPLLNGDFVSREGISSSGFVRLTVADETLGLLFVNSSAPHNFIKEERGAVELFANLAALAIWNVRHYAQLQSEVSELEVLLAMQEGHADSGSRMKRFEEAAEILMKEGYDNVAIYPYDPLARKFETPTLQGDFIHYEDVIGAIRQEGTVVGRRMVEGGEYYFTNTPKEPDDLHFGNFVKREGIQASASLRLRSNGRLFGLLFVNKREPFRFTEQRRQLLRVTATTLANAQREVCERHYDSVQREHLAQIRRKVGNTLDLDEVRDEIYKGLRKMFGQDARPALLMYNEVEENLKLLYTETLSEDVDVPEEQGRIVLNMEEGICGWVARKRQAANVSDVRLDGRYLPMHRATCSELAVPIIGRDEQLIGVLDVESPQVGRFSEEDKQWLYLVASEVATAVWNAAQYRRRGRLLKAFQNSIHPIMSSPKLAPTLQAILAEAAKLTGSHLATIQELRDEHLCLIAVHPTEILDDLRASIGDCLSMEDDTVTVKAARTRQIQRVHDTSENASFLSSGLKESGSELAMPIHNEDGTVWGVLNVEWRSTNAFDEEDALALSSLASLAGVALQTIKRTDELRRASEVAALGVWGAILAHDNNTTVAAIRRSVFVLEEKTELPPEARERLRQIDEYAKEMDMLELLASPPEPGKPIPFTSTALVDEVLQAEILRFRQVHDDACFELNLACPNLRAAIHERWLQRILRLLVNNALNAPGGQDRQIIISSEQHSGHIKIRIRDNAAGIPNVHREDLFERPIVHENGRSSRGALLIRLLVDSHGGRLDPIQTATGEGTTIAFSLPLAKED